MKPSEDGDEHRKLGEQRGSVSATSADENHF